MTRVAVIGGGCASLTAAFELTRPEHAGKYEVTVYQMGWRLGGKGASGRGVADRIEEHGLHLWMGFYENAFRLMRECYAELDAPPGRRLTTFDEAFKPAPDVAVMDQLPGGNWAPWRAHFPPGRGMPGDDLRAGGPFTIRGYLRQSAMLIGELLRSAQDIENGRSAQPSATASAATAASAPLGADGVAASAERLLRYGQLATVAALFEAMDVVRQGMDAFFPAAICDPTGVIVRLIEALSVAAREQLQRIVAGDNELRRVWQVIDVILAVLRGATLTGLALDARGFDAINEYDWREWLRLHGASEESLQSGFMRGIYDLAFAFEDGDVTRPRLAAGVALRGAMRMFFTYRGALFWRMSAGMGDVVFAPLYEVLKQRGVKFEFFHRLRNVVLAPPRADETPFVSALEFDVQAKPKRSGEYDPLVLVNGVACWPSEPDYEQLAGGARMKREGRAFEGHWEDRIAGTTRLEVVRDFDFVVLGVSIGALPYVARELIDRDPRWREMVRHVKTVPTQAFQVWLREDMNALGWPHPPSNLSGFVEPFDTWADMGHLIGEEGWTRPVASIAYFCSVLPDRAPPGDAVTREFNTEQRQFVRNNAVGFLNRDIGVLWPGAVRTSGGFRWELLATERGRVTASNASVKRTPVAGPIRFDTQYWTANVNPSDRYVLSLPGSVVYRLSPLDTCFDNLTIAGDWTATGLDTGCIESAVISGRLAAHALSHLPRLEEIVGYDHP